MTTTKQLGIIGDPVSHSFSPKMHNYISECLNNGYTYSAYHVTSENLENAINNIRTSGICGVNVTSPHKIDVIKYLDEISDDARIMMSVNTVVNDNGKLIGYNTDSEGFYLSLKNAGIDIKNKNILVMGCGGVTIPIIIRMIKENPKSLTLLNRTKKKAVFIADKINEICGYIIKTDIQCTFDVVINTTTAGMEHLADVLPWDNIPELQGFDFIDSNTSAVDLIYNPPCTKFLKYAKSKGAKTLNGLDMLIYQGVIAYELFTGEKVSDEIVDNVRKEVFNV